MPSPEKVETSTCPRCPRQGSFVDFLDDLEPGWDMGGAALLREAQPAGLGVDSAQGGAALEDAGVRPRLRADGGLVPGAAVADGASRWGRMCWIAFSASAMLRTAGKSLRRCHRTASTGRCGAERVCFVDARD